MGRVSLLLDTDVLVEFFRGSPRAHAWLSSRAQDVIGVPVIVLMELLQGARDRSEQQRIAQRLAILPVEQLEVGDSSRAAEWFAAYRLSHGVGILDCLIAAIAHRVGVPFYTFNGPHFHAIPGLDARQPYERTEGQPADEVS
jgi:predicted nucleic acid-binding protein